MLNKDFPCKICEAEGRSDIDMPHFHSKTPPPTIRRSEDVGKGNVERPGMGNLKYLGEQDPPKQTAEQLHHDYEILLDTVKQNLLTRLQTKVKSMGKQRLDSPRSFGDGEIVNVAPGYNQALDDVLKLLKEERG